MTYTKVTVDTGLGLETVCFAASTEREKESEIDIIRSEHGKDCVVRTEPCSRREVKQFSVGAFC